MTIGRLAWESEAYRARRDELLEAEIALKEQRERVAALRRTLPRDTPVEDYELEVGPASLDAGDAARVIRLSELFGGPERPLVLFHFMYGGAQASPCPMCSMWIDGYQAAARHLQQRVDLAVVARADLASLRGWARLRGWTDLGLVSSRRCSMKRDLGFEDDAGAQMPGVSVFARSPDGSPRHFYSASAYLSDDHPYRGMDLLSPVWNVLDLTPEGRGDWLPALEY